MRPAHRVVNVNVNNEAMDDETVVNVTKHRQANIGRFCSAK